MLAFAAQTVCLLAAVRFSLWLEARIARARWKRKNASRVVDLDALVRRRTFVADRLAIDSQLQRVERRVSA